MDDERRSTLEDRVVVVLAGGGKAGVAAVLVAREVVAVVPASRALAQVAPDGPHVPDLRRADLAGRHRQQRRSLLDHRVLDDVGEQRGRADAQPGTRCANALQLRKVSDRYEPLGSGEIVFHLAEEIGTAGNERDLAVLLSQLVRSVSEGGGPAVAEVVHHDVIPPLDRPARAWPRLAQRAQDLRAGERHLAEAYADRALA